MITNIVCNADLKCCIDLKLLVSKTTNITYQPGKFSAAIWKHKTIGGTCMVFANGKVMINGKVSSVKDAKRRVRRYARLLQKLGWNVRLSSINISTISAAFKLDGPLDIHAVVRHYGASYDAELYPAAMFVKDCVHYTCFYTGNVLMTGIKTERQLYTTVTSTLMELLLL